jgi:hypothetical protein
MKPLAIRHQLRLGCGESLHSSLFLILGTIKRSRKPGKRASKKLNKGVGGQT